jgi:hypothetical protein
VESQENKKLPTFWGFRNFKKIAVGWPARKADNLGVLPTRARRTFTHFFSVYHLFLSVEQSNFIVSCKISTGLDKFLIWRLHAAHDLLPVHAFMNH